MDKAKVWTKEEFAEWIRAHIGEYVMQKARVHKRIKTMATVEFNAMFAKELNALAELDGKGLSKKNDEDIARIFESMIALAALIPSEDRGDEYTAVIEDGEDWIWAIKETEEDVRRVIEQMVAHAVK